MNKLILTFALLLAPAAAVGQSSGLPAPVAGTVGNCVKIGTGNVAADNGSACGSGGTGVQYNPSNTLYVFTGDSVIADDTNVLGPNITINGSCNGTVCTVTNTGNNGLSAGDWVYTSYFIAPPAPFGTDSTTYSMFQVLPTGLSATGFQFNYSVGTATITNQNARPANYFLPFSAMNQPFFKGHGTVNVTTDQSYSIAGYATDYAALFHSISPAATGNNPEYLILNDIFNNDIQLCTSAATIEADLQSFWQQAHTDGWIVVQGTSTSTPWNTTSLGCVSAFSTRQAVNTWLLGQGKSFYNTSGASTGEYWDRLADVGAILNNPTDTNLIATNGGLAPGGVQAYTQVLNAALSNQASDVRYSNEGLYYGTAPDSPGNSRGQINVAIADNSQSFVWINTTGTLQAFGINTATGFAGGGGILADFPGTSVGTSPLQVVNPTASSQSIATMFAPNLPTSDYTYWAVGVDSGTNDYVATVFNYAGSTSASNSASIALHNENGINIYGDSGVSIPSVATSPSTSPICPNGTAGRLTTSGCTSSAVTWATPTTGTATSKATFPGGDLFNGGVNAQTGTSYTIVLTDENKVTTYSNSSAVAVTLPQATTTGFGAGAYFKEVNLGTGAVTITPTTSTINGAPSLVLATGQSAELTSDGTNYTAELGSAAAGYTGTSPIVVSGTAISCPTCSTGSGTNVEINGGSALGTANLNGTTPAAPTGNQNVTWQVSGNNVSAYVPTGAMVLLEEHTASSSAALQFTSCISSTYDDYIFKGISLIPGTDTVSLIMQYSQNGGTSYDSTSGHYRWGYVYVGDSGAASTVNSASDSSITVGGGFTTFTASSGDFSIELFNPASTTSRLKTTEDTSLDNGSGAGLPYRYSGFSQYNITPAAVNAVQFLFNSGNIASGTIRCYGLAH
jgi:hypothetical protein